MLRLRVSLASPQSKTKRILKSGFPAGKASPLHESLPQCWDASKTEAVEPLNGLLGFAVTRWTRYRRVFYPYAEKAYYFILPFNLSQGEKPMGNKRLRLSSRTTCGGQSADFGTPCFRVVLAPQLLSSIGAKRNPVSKLLNSRKVRRGSALSGLLKTVLLYDK